MSNRYLLVVVVLFVLGLTVGCSSSPESREVEEPAVEIIEPESSDPESEDPQLETTLTETTVNAPPTNTPPILGPTVTTEPANASEPAEEPTAVPEPTLSPTPPFPWMIVLQNMTIRDGPGTHYLPQDSLPQGDQSQILGKADPLGFTWWKIPCPAETPSDECWVSGGDEFVSVSNADDVPDAPIPLTPLERQAVPPGGVAAQIGITPGIIPSDRPCLKSAPVPTIITPEDNEILGELEFCMYGFAYDQAIQVEITSPDGEVIKIEMIPGGNTLIWGARPGDPYGVYTIIAKEGQLQATAEFTVNAASTPRILITPDKGPPGTHFQMAVAGYSPGEWPASLYRFLDECQETEVCWDYLTPITPVKINDRGEATYTLKTVPTDPDGLYRIYLGTPPDTVNFLNRKGNFIIGS